MGYYLPRNGESAFCTSSGVKGLEIRKLAPEFMAISLIPLDVSEVIKPKGT
jgi:hypothetical protein